MIEIKNLSGKYSYDEGIDLVELKNISLQIPDGNIISILGKSDFGRSTLLQLIAGMKNPLPGEVHKPFSAKIVLIPSAPSSFPWLDVIQNVNFGLDVCDDKTIKELINLVGLDGYEKFYPDNKSLGFRFRITLARSLAHNPDLIVMDEPFSTMDNRTRDEMYSLIKTINQKNKTTFLLATSNITEAVILSNKICFMKCSPTEIFSEIEVDLGQTRDLSTYSSEKFESIRAQIVSAFGNNSPELLFNLSL